MSVMQQLHKHLLLNSICFSSDIQENVWSKPTGTTTDSLVYKASYIHMQEVVNIPLTGKKVIQKISMVFFHYRQFLAG
jgi:hypothetical protein